MKEIHRCYGDPAQCEYAAVCEECGHSATAERPVLQFEDEGEGFFLCEHHASYLGDSDELDALPVTKIINHGPARWVENPETGEGSWAGTTEDGYPVLASGAIEGCECGECENREDWDE